MIRSLGLTLGVVVGAGIFVLPAYVASLLPMASFNLLAWLLGALISLCVAFCYAELATTFPETGGYVVYLRRIFGPRVAFVYGWAAILVLYPSSIAGLARVTGRSVASLFELEGSWIVVIAAAGLLVAVLLNVLGINLSSRTQVLLSSLKVSALLLLHCWGSWRLRA